jgi:hypothetical protein
LLALRYALPPQVGVRPATMANRSCYVLGLDPSRSLFLELSLKPRLLFLLETICLQPIQVNLDPLLLCLNLCLFIPIYVR